MKKTKCDDIIIYDLSYYDVDNLGLGIPIKLDDNHFITAKGYIQQLEKDDYEYKGMINDDNFLI